MYALSAFIKCCWCICLLNPAPPRDGGTTIRHDNIVSPVCAEGAEDALVHPPLCAALWSFDMVILFVAAAAGHSGTSCVLL